MSKFNTIEISDLVSLHPKVETHRFFGLFERVFYQPTRSTIESFRNFYDASEARILQQIAESIDPTQALHEAHEMQTSAQGDYRLDMCMSGDCQFAAFQLFKRQPDGFAPCSRLCFLEGAHAAAFEDLLA